MMTTKIEKMLKIAVDHAICEGFTPEKNPHYCVVRDIVDRFKAGEELTFEEKEKAGYSLRNLYAWYGLNYEYTLKKIFEEEEKEG